MNTTTTDMMSETLEELRVATMAVGLVRSTMSVLGANDRILELEQQLRGQSLELSSLGVGELLAHESWCDDQLRLLERLWKAPELHSAMTQADAHHVGLMAQLLKRQIMLMRRLQSVSESVELAA